MRTSTQYNTVSANDSARSRSKNPTMHANPFNRQTAAPTSPASRWSTPRDKKLGHDEPKQNVGKKKVLVCYKCGGKGHSAWVCPSADECQDVDEVGTEPCSDADSDLFDLDWGDDPIASIASWRGPPSRKVGLASKARTGHTSSTTGGGGVVSKRALGSNMNTTWEVADVRQPMISAGRPLERGHKLVLDETPRIQCKSGDTVALERCGSLFAVRLWIP